MDRAWVDEVIGALGARYQAGAIVEGRAVELLYRAGKTEFRPSRVLLGGGESGREIELVVDVRIPKDSVARDADPLIGALERGLTERGFSRTSEETTEMTSQTGAASGSVRTLVYRHAACPTAEAAKQVRAVVESVEIPVVLGIHEARDVAVRDPPPPGPRPVKEVMEVWRFRLDSSLLHALMVVVDPNDRTLKVEERKGVSTKQLGDVVKLAHVAELAVRRRDGRAELIAIKRDGAELLLASGSGTADFVATAGRLAKQVMIPFKEVR